MRVERRSGYRVIVGGPVPPQADAITLGRTIVVRRSAADSARLMAHELVHVRQFRELGVVRFLVRYLGSYLRGRLAGHGHLAAYRRIPLEVEASWVSRLRTVHDLEPDAAPSARQGSPPVRVAAGLRSARASSPGPSRRRSARRLRTGASGRRRAVAGS